MDILKVHEMKKAILKMEYDLKLAKLEFQKDKDDNLRLAYLETERSRKLNQCLLRKKELDIQIMEIRMEEMIESLKKLMTKENA